MILLKQKRGRRSRGGRKVRGTGSGDPVKHHVVLNDRVYDIIDSERRPDETNNECLLRMLTERTYEISKLRKKVDALECRLEQFQEPPTEMSTATYTAMDYRGTSLR